ncbi:MAG: hypothetical protein A2145_01280 [candidate division Zixibacteria bacterium RBG_16_40_9]|nr:MAG: hypothetical protein A2145_01280 [candidate division Zixibacteria bacterium RBG_16_40_9]
MKTWVLILGLILLNSNFLQGAFEDQEIDPKSIGLGNAFLSLCDNSNSVFLNPAGLSFLSQPQVYVGYSNAYGLSELSQTSLSIAYPKKSWGVGLGISVFGKSDFYQEKVGVISGAYNFKNKISFGLSFKYLTLSSTSNYPELKAAGLDAGFRWKFMEKVEMGGVVKNFNQPKFGEDKIPLNYNLGLAYYPLKEIALFVGYYDDADFKSQIRLGQETYLNKNLSVRFGFQSQPSRYSLGFGFNWENFKLDYAYFNHPVLDATHKVGLTWEWGK